MPRITEKLQLIAVKTVAAVRSHVQDRNCTRNAKE
jgi:hypothetical protein